MLGWDKVGKEVVKNIVIMLLENCEAEKEENLRNMSHRKYHEILYHKILCFLYYSMTTKKSKYEEGKVKIIKSYSRL